MIDRSTEMVIFNLHAPTRIKSLLIQRVKCVKGTWSEETQVIVFELRGRFAAATVAFLRRSELDE